VKIKINNKKLDVKLCNTFTSKLIGLMFSKRKNLLFEFNNEGYHAIHMFFVFYPVRIAWINKNKKVVDVKLAYPFQPLLAPKEKAMYVLEAHPNFDIRLNDEIVL